MSEGIKMVALRIRSLRELSDFSIEEVAELVHVDKDVYALYESGEEDIPVSVLYELARVYNIDMTVLLTGEDPHVKACFVVRKNMGVAVERRKEYGYQSLGYGFVNKSMEPFMVTVPPADSIPHKYAHRGNEFSLILEGAIELEVGTYKVRLDEGDSVYFDSGYEHGMRALDGKPAKFLSVISK